jgi:YidC/Oxa1 family membrane protein insertase
VIPNNEKPNFLDRGTLTAMALMLMFWFGWTRYIESQYPKQDVGVVSHTDSKTTEPQKSSVPETGVESGKKQSVVGSSESRFLPESIVGYESDLLAFKISSKGMGLKDINVKKYKTRENAPVVLGQAGEVLPLSTFIDKQNLSVADFKINKEGDNKFVGTALVDGLKIEKSMIVQPGSYIIDVEIKIQGDDGSLRAVRTALGDRLPVEQKTGLLAQQPDYSEWFLEGEGKKVREVVHTGKPLEVALPIVSTAALSSHYFTVALVDRSDVLPSFESHFGGQGGYVEGVLKHVPLNQKALFKVGYRAFVGPKSFGLLSDANDQLSRVVDYGMFGVIGKPILWMLKYLFTILGNWGFAIIALTILVRLLVLPFNAYSFKSMKAMQAIQPEMNRIKAKYENKPAEAKLQMNQEIMQLMKDNNANPVGGCLPTLLQLPVFLALYQVLGQSIELYRAPFGLWIHDLSASDPFFVLPILMGVAMFLQQKMTPTAVDPQQAKVLMWMPVIFSFFMLSLPSGLTLYIFISTLFGIIQQYYFMRETSAVSSRVKEA